MRLQQAGIQVPTTNQRQLAVFTSRRAAMQAPAASPVWASFRGPEADDYEALPDEPAGEQGAELVPRRRHVSTHRRCAPGRAGGEAPAEGNKLLVAQCHYTA